MVVAVDVFDNKLAKARDEGAVVTVNARSLLPEQVAQAVCPVSKETETAPGALNLVGRG